MIIIVNDEDEDEDNLEDEEEVMRVDLVDDNEDGR